jgi:hypothetical protein
LASAERLQLKVKRFMKLLQRELMR